MIDDQTIERVALEIEVPIGTVARVLRAALSPAGDGEPAEPWARLTFWEIRVRTAAGPASASVADAGRRAARAAIMAAEIRSQTDAAYRRGKACGYGEGVVAGWDMAAERPAEPEAIRNHRAALTAPGGR